MLEVIGREDEVAALEAFIDLALIDACALVIRGVAGIGKTTLWREAVATARGRSVTVLSCRPAGSETQLPYAGLWDLLAPAGEAALAGLPAPQRRALEVALLRATPEGPPLEQRSVATAVLGVLTELARSGPLLVAVDDVQWLDVASSRALAFALRRVGEVPLGVLLSVRGEPGDELPLGLDRTLAEDRVKSLEVGPLSLDALDRLLGTRLNHVFRRPVLLQVQRVSGGNPLFALDLCRALLRRKTRPGLEEHLPVPGTLRGLMTERLGSLSGSGRQAARAVAALSCPTLNLLRQAADPSGIEELFARGALDSDGEDGAVRFAHPLLASTIYAEASANDRRRLHRQLAGVVTEPGERARHLALSAEPPNRGVAAALDDAARLARARGAPESAAALSEQAIRFTSPEQAAGLRRRRLEAADAHFLAGELAESRELLEAVVASSPPGLGRGRALQRLGEVRAQEVGWRAAESVFEAALADAGEDASLRAQVECDLAFVSLIRGDVAGAATHAQVAFELAEDLGDEALLLATLSYSVLFEFVNGKGVDPRLFERAAGLDDRALAGALEVGPGFLHVPHVVAAILKWTDDFEAARARLVQAYRRAMGLGDESSLPHLCYHLGELECWAGNYELAARYAAEGCRAAERTGQEEVLASTLYTRALVEAHRGEVEAARRDAEESISLAARTGVTTIIPLSLSVLGFLALSIGDAAGTIRHLGPLTQVLAVMGVAEPAVVRYVPDEIEALVVLGELDRAEPLLDSFEERGRALDRAWALATGARCRGLLLAARGDVPGALAALDCAVREHARLVAPFELGRTLLVQGVVRRRARLKAGARQSLEEALCTFESLGAPLWAGRAQEERARIDGGRPAPTVLSATEDQVAKLVVAGHSNQEVAARLFMSVKTVEANLTRIYRKMGVASRRQLARRVHVESS